MPFLKAAAPFVIALPFLAPKPAPPPRDDRIVMVVDGEDADADGTPDREQLLKVPSKPALFVVKARPKGADAALWAAPDTAAVRVIADGAAVAKGAPIPQIARTIALQAVRPGAHKITLFGKPIEVRAFELQAADNKGAAIDWARSHASFERTPPERLGKDPYAPHGDPDALRFVVMGPGEDIPATLTLLSITESGAPLDTLQDVPLGEVPCPSGAPAGLTCGSTVPIRAVADDVDRSHPMARARSLKAVLGGALMLQTTAGVELQRLRVAGPRATPAGPIDRLRAALRLILVRLRPQGPPPLGGDDASAVATARAEAAQAALLWSACGVGFGPPEELSVTIVDPPRPHLVAVGCDQGLPASGGALRVRADGHEVTAKVTKGMTPAAAARALAAAVTAVGLTAKVSENAAMGAGAGGSADVLVRRRDGTLALVEGPSQGAISTDATLTACVGKVDLTDGLTHFGDNDAYAGTVEERTLLKAFDDGDPTTIEVVIVPGFAQGGRVGESFITADRSAIRNALIEDRAAVRSDRASFALAHELGHVLLDEPGHPDDYGADTPTRLMDSDAASPTAFGPRRLTLEECGRALKQSGPGAPSVLLRSWPLGPLTGR